MGYTYHTQRDSLTLTSAPKVKRGRPKGVRSIEDLQAYLRALPGGEAVYRRLRKEAMEDKGRSPDEVWRSTLREAITELEGR